MLTPLLQQFHCHHRQNCPSSTAHNCLPSAKMGPSSIALHKTPKRINQNRIAQSNPGQNNQNTPTYLVIWARVENVAFRPWLLRLQFNHSAASAIWACNQWWLHPSSLPNRCGRGRFSLHALGFNGYGEELGIALRGLGLGFGDRGMGSADNKKQRRRNWGFCSTSTS